MTHAVSRRVVLLRDRGRSCVPFPAPARQSVHAVLPHTAYRRRSPPAFGFTRQARKGLGATTIPSRLISPSWFGPTRRRSPTSPNARVRRCFLAMNRAIRVTRVIPDLVEAPGRVPVPEVPGPAAQEAVDVSPRSSPPAAAVRRRSVSSRIRSRACCIALSAGQRARKATPLPPVRPCARTSRWWKPRKSRPSPPTAGARSGSWPPSVPDRARPAVPATAPARLRPARGNGTSPARRRRNAPAPHARARPTPGRSGAGRRCQQRRDHAALRGAGHLAPHRTVLHHPRAQHRAQQLEHGLVTDAFLDRLHQLVMRNRRKAVGDIRLDHPPAAPPGLIDEDLQGIVRRPLGAEPERARQQVGLEDRLEHDLAPPPARSGPEPQESTTAAARSCPASG